MKDKIRILHIGLGNFVYGTERVALNLYGAMDREQYQFDFLIDHKCDKLKYEKEITELGGNVYYQFYYLADRYASGYISPEEFFERHPEIYGVHLHTNDYSFSQFRYLMVAKKKGLPVRIIHSHNSRMMIRTLKNHVNRAVALVLLRKYSNKFLACSEEAGRWKFKKLDYEILPNGVDTDRFRFNEAMRRKMRSSYHLEDRLVLGFAGRLEEEKNPEFLLRVLQEINRKRDDIVLVILGGGELEAKLRAKTEKENLKNVFFMGRVDNVHEWFQAFDVLLLPSLFEGLGLVLIEAQAGGLMCMASNYVPREAAITDRICFLGIERAKDWADKILEIDFSYDRKKGSGDVASARYDVKDSAKRLEEIYQKLIF